MIDMEFCSSWRIASQYRQRIIEPVGSESAVIPIVKNSQEGQVVESSDCMVQNGS